MENGQGMRRNGESPNRFYGGNVSDNPFPKALFDLATLKGMPSQRSLAMALEKESSSIVQAWYTGRTTPTQREFNSILRVLNPTDEERKTLVDLYRQAHPTRETATDKKRKLMEQKVKELTDTATKITEKELREQDIHIGTAVLRRIQASLPYRTFNLDQAGALLGVSGEAIRLKRIKFNLPLLLTDAHLEIIKADLNPKMAGRKLRKTPQLDS